MHAGAQTQARTWAERVRMRKGEEEEGGKRGWWGETGTESEDLSGCRSEEDQRRAEAKIETTRQPDQARSDRTSCTTTAKQVGIKL